MIFVAVDGDREALARLERSIKTVFDAAEVAAFTDAMSAYQYCVNHAREISVVFVPVILKPFNGFKLCELLLTLPVPLHVVFTLRENCGELRELVTSNGAYRNIIKPVTPEKLSGVAQDLIADCVADQADCKRCALCWCPRWTGTPREIFETGGIR